MTSHEHNSNSTPVAHVSTSLIKDLTTPSFWSPPQQLCDHFLHCSFVDTLLLCSFKFHICVCVKSSDTY